MRDLHIDIRDGRFNLGYAGEETIENDTQIIWPFSCKCVVSVLTSAQKYLQNEHNYVHIKGEHGDYSLLIGVEVSGAEVLRYNDFSDFISRQEKDKIAFQAILQYLLKGMDLGGTKLTVSLSELESGYINIYKTEIPDDNTSYPPIEEYYAFIEDILPNLTPLVKPIERTISSLIKKCETDTSVLESTSTFLYLKKEALILYTTDAYDELIVQNVVRIPEISILSLFENLKKEIREKTGFQNMPLGENVLSKALSNGHLGSARSGIYVDLRSEVNELLNGLASQIVDALNNYVSSNPDFGAWYFTGHLSESLYGKISKLLDDKFSNKQGISCQITHLAGEYAMFVNLLQMVSMNTSVFTYNDHQAHHNTSEE